MGRRRSQYRSPRRSSRRTVSAIFCPATHCLPFMDFYDQKPTAWVAIGRAPNSHSGEKKEVDYRGHGQSEYDRNPHNYTLPAGVADLSAVIIAKTESIV